MLGDAGTWYRAFPEHYLWSFVTMQALNSSHSGGSLPGEIYQIVARLQSHVGQPDAWCREWSTMATRVREFAEREGARGHRQTAAHALTRSAIYHYYAERVLPPEDPRKGISYREVPDRFLRAMKMGVSGFERVEIPYEGTSLPAYYVPPLKPESERSPTAIILPGLDSCKELSVLWGGLALRDRNIGSLCVDGPGQGETIRLRNIPHRYDAEVPVRAMVDYLSDRPDVDPARIGLIGVSMGGYLAPRAAAFEKRIKAVATWGALYDYHTRWMKRLDLMKTGGYIANFPTHISWVMGVETMEQVIEKLKEFKLDGVAEKITCSLLVLHGADDAVVPPEDAERLFKEAASKDKELRIFNVEDGGSQHCVQDNIAVSGEAIADWLADRL